MRWILTSALIWLGGIAVAATGCLRPVDGAHFDVATGGVSDFCLTTARYTAIPGYPKLIIARDACGLRTIEDGRLVALEADYPHQTSWAFRNFDVARDGTVYGYGGRTPRQVYRMRPGEEQFEALPIEGYRAVDYDPREDRLLVQAAGAPLREWTDAGGLRISSLAGLTHELNDVLPRYFEGVNGYLSFAGGRLYWRGETAERWVRVPLGWFDRNLPDDLWMLMPQRSYLDAAAGLFALQFSDDLLVFDVSNGGAPTFLYTVREARDVFHIDDGPIAAVIGGVLLTRTESRNIVRILGREGPRLVVPDDAVTGGRAHALVVPRNGWIARGVVSPPLFRVQDAWMFFDGQRFLSAPELGRAWVGSGPRWIQWGDRLFSLSQNGWGEVQDDLSIRAVPAPVAFRSPFDVEVAVSALFGAFLAARDGRGLWHSRDGASFARVDTGDVNIRRYVSDLPDGEAGVVLAEDGLYLLDQSCFAEGATR